jgi:hypothetical protein
MFLENLNILVVSMSRTRYESNVVEMNEHLISRADLPVGHQLKTVVQNA